jgi:glyceraldehyde 3-phosphate dehydrogenase
MTTRVGINGFGRIGRAFTRLAADRTDLEVVAVNDITNAGTLAHLLAFDSTFGRFGRTVEHTEDSLIIDGRPVAVLSERDPANIDWAKLGADVVIESTGKFRTRDDAALHLKGGVRPAVGRASPSSSRMVVVFPAPLGPR